MIFFRFPVVIEIVISSHGNVLFRISIVNVNVPVSWSLENLNDEL